MGLCKIQRFGDGGGGDFGVFLLLVSCWFRFSYVMFNCILVVF
jgi:hypothetical protein